MTSVNSPACLLARNQFYRNKTSPTESIKPTAVYSFSDWSMLQVLVWVTMSTQPGFPGAGGISKGWWVSVVLGSPKPRTVPSSARPAHRPAHSSPPPLQPTPAQHPHPAPPVQHPGPAPPANRAVQCPQPTLTRRPLSSAPVQRPGPAPRSSAPVQRPGPAPLSSAPVQRPQPTERSSRDTPPPINRLKHTKGKDSTRKTREKTPSTLSVLSAQKYGLDQASRCWTCFTFCVTPKRRDFCKLS
ncbi:uncharacterized protein LOC118372006 [Oncorhynchus keta]|uniref:uncharacterized protein LOC118372006 n=1 Tax=Oncorhynchus keta TaxID=8018 RepID=UPI00227A55F5|nr:uncharacterized protein LOC118372006 [Oncorhynchus keta]